MSLWGELLKLEDEVGIALSPASKKDTDSIKPEEPEEEP